MWINVMDLLKKVKRNIAKNNNIAEHFCHLICRIIEYNSGLMILQSGNKSCNKF